MRQVYLSCAAWQRTKLCSFGAGGRARRGLRSGVAVLRQLPVPRSEHLLLRRRCSESDGGAGSSILMAEYRSPIDRGGGGGGRLRCIARGVSLPPRTGLLRFSRPAVGRPAPRRKHPASAASRLQPPPPPPRPYLRVASPSRFRSTRTLHSSRSSLGCRRFCIRLRAFGRGTASGYATAPPTPSRFKVKAE